MSRILFDAFDVAGVSVNVAGVASAQTSSALLRGIARVSVAGVASAQVSAAAVEVSGPSVTTHADAPAPRFFDAIRVRFAPTKDPGEILDYTFSYAKLLQ